MNVMDAGDESDDEHKSTEMIEDIRDGGQSHPSINRGKSRYKIRYRIKRENISTKCLKLS